ncbi:MAG: PilZ domain-containing protein [Desulfuromonadaceae bacterium]|nr:PilZ domain-containing protein [Desulfuromonadaceae bacterium]MDD5107400.1 PilZ domain-containing protein [Desulfuromonadaceae bacterium]
MNSRHFTRVDYSVGASVRYGNNVVLCNTDNVSLRGMYLKTDHQIPLDVPVHVTVYSSSQSSLKFNAKVVRKEADGVGLQINNLNVHSFVQLRDIVTEHCNDQGKVMQETYKMLKCIY